ncbi:SGNH/GDSL hydrolase family protein [Lipingzhangella sp. LS1_29]|uniref:SGNH/GDSL hydrolase family protein n=1 Tax=Lipingzhangella rawalii TaxID=2055835 RepID=A0ABU2H1C2_9ACTN|nr:SGNH/GDSL hydrolase family protein [Lipingzhangella rawalii]MDS1269110.1 SGNH/GDSL hydrolase family protein [Lipingzhangella rawalii]
MVPNQVEIVGAVGVERGTDYLRPWRLPPEDMELHHPRLVAAASGSSGVRLRFRTTACALGMDVEPVGQSERLDGLHPPYQLVINGRVQPVVLGPPHRSVVRFDGVEPAGTMNNVELWLPELAGVRLYDLGSLDGAQIEAPYPTGAPRWIVYGSSITHGLLGAPAQTWPAVAARRLRREVTNLGFAGECHLDPLVGQMIAERPAEFITLKLGINVHNWQSQRERAFRPAVHGLLATIRYRQPYTQITVVSPIHSPPREASTDTVIDLNGQSLFRASGDLTLEQMRDILAEVVHTRRRRGDTALHYIDGQELLGKDDTAHLLDGLHPDQAGLELMGERYAERAPA